ncbi:MAG TPA: hypothetical protein VFE63_13005 [Roseiarcus sp.]|nr:hypothetical protein [Roseiarcus sp.]
MNRWSLRQALVLLLAVFVTTGMGLSAVRANDMAAKMAMPSGMGAAAGHAGCQHCPDGAGKGGAKATPCATVCGALIMPRHHDPEPTIMAPTAAVYPASLALRHGRALRPDPHPPRTSDIG